jgi:hypothetical protein
MAKHVAVAGRAQLILTQETAGLQTMRLARRNAARRRKRTAALVENRTLH